MEIREMTIEQVEERLAEIKGLIDTAENLDELSAEVDALNERKADIVATAEQRAAILGNIADNNAGNTIAEMEKPKMEEARTFAPNTEEYRKAWLKEMAGVALDAEERTAMATADVVPTITENTIINRLKENALLKLIDFTQYKGYVNIPNYTTNGDAAWSTGNEQQDEIGHVGLSLYQLIKTVEVPGVFDANSIDAFESKMVEGLVNKLETALQTAVITGDGSNKPTGINSTHSTADGTFTKAGITFADLMKIMGKLDDKYQKDACWIMPSAVFYEAMANVKLPGFVGLSDGMQKMIAGKPVVTDSACVISSTDTIFYGAAKAYHLNLGSGGIKVDKDASIGFKNNAINYRGVCAADGKLDNVNAFVKYTRATA